MNTQTILAALDGGVLDTDKAVRKLCEAVDTQGALLAGLRQNMTAAIATMEKIDETLSDSSLNDRQVVDLIASLVADAMGEKARCKR